MTQTTKQRLQQNFPVIPTGNEYRKQLGTTVVCVATPETSGIDAPQGDDNMTGYSYSGHQPAGVAILAQQLHHERQRAKYWESRARAAERRPRAHSLPLTNAAWDVEAPLPTTTVESE